MTSRLQRIIDWSIVARHANYNAKNLAQICGTSLRQLERYCKNSGRPSPEVWLRSMQIDEAKTLLPKPLLIKEVAFAVGFKQVSHFCREFKRSTGQTPGCFAILHRLPASPTDNTGRPQTI